MPDTLLLEDWRVARTEAALAVDLTEARDRDLVRRIERG